MVIVITFDNYTNYLFTTLSFRALFIKDNLNSIESQFLGISLNMNNCMESSSCVKCEGQKKWDRCIFVNSTVRSTEIGVEEMNGCVQSISFEILLT